MIGIAFSLGAFFEAQRASSARRDRALFIRSGFQMQASCLSSSNLAPVAFGALNADPGLQGVTDRLMDLSAVVGRQLLFVSSILGGGGARWNPGMWVWPRPRAGLAFAGSAYLV